MAAATSSNIEHDPGDSILPSWLANHLNIEWNSDDIDALLTSIDASQSPKAPTLPHLPAELLILILEYVPIAYILDWRLVCRGFRDAIDGPILYHHIQRAQLVGYLGSRNSLIMGRLNDSEYEKLHLVPAWFQSLGEARVQARRQEQPSPIWSNTYATFKLCFEWWSMHERFYRPGFPTRYELLSRVMLCRTDQGYGTLSWAIRLDTSIFDLDIPLDANRRTFDINVDIMETQTVLVEWKPLMFQFLKNERALRLLMEEKHDSSFTFSHAEDCLRAIRRQRLHAALDPDSKVDRHIKWSLRLLRPLWGLRGHRDPSTLDPIEADAAKVLLLLRRKAALSRSQIEHLESLAKDYEVMVSTMNELSRSVTSLKNQLILPGQHATMELDVAQTRPIPINPIAWTDKLRTDIEARVQKWRAQQDLIEQMQVLMVASHEALAVPEDAFDVMELEF
jgi:hypothetical protein